MSVQHDLSDRGYRVMSVRPARNGWRWIYREFPTFFKVSTSDLVQFSRQLSTFIKVGVPIVDAIKLLQEASNSGAFRAALEDISEDLDAGEAFSTSISHHPSVFNQLYIDMVRAAEYSGTLDRVLSQIAVYLQRQDQALEVADAEIISVICDSMEALGVSNYQVRFSSRRVLNLLLAYASITPERWGLLAIASSRRGPWPRFTQL